MVRVASPLGTGSSWNIGGEWDPGLAESPEAEFSEDYFDPIIGDPGDYEPGSRAGLPVEQRSVVPFSPGLSTALTTPTGQSVFQQALPAIAGGVATAITGQPEVGVGVGMAASGIGLLLGEGGDPSAIGEPWWFEGPGLYEPPAQYVVKEWKKRIDSSQGDYNLQYYLVKLPGRAYEIWMYSQRTRMWKHWKMPKPAVIGKNLPSHKMLTRLRHNLKRHKDDAKTILRLTDPTFMAKAAGTYRRRSRRR